MTIGHFRNCETRVWFEYSKRPEEDRKHWAGDFPHAILMCDGSYRAALVLKTRAYVCIDEDAYGKPVIEKWVIKQ